LPRSNVLLGEVMSFLAKRINVLTGGAK